MEIALQYGIRYILPVVLLSSVLFATGTEAAQTCVNCVGVPPGEICLNQSQCNNNEVCHMSAYMDHSGQVLQDYGCKSIQACYHSVEPVAIGRRSISTRNDVMCDVCCNETYTCNQKLCCPTSASGTNATGSPLKCSELGILVNKNGTCTIHPYAFNTSLPVDVRCEYDAAGHEWTVIQKRFNGSVNFYRNWQFYKNGFGSPSGEHWIGNDLIHALTYRTHRILRIEMSDFENVTKYAEYSTFRVGDENSGYRLFVDGYTGNAGDALTFHNGSKFSTFDRDNDRNANVNCAQHYHGAWWYTDCHLSNLNGQYLSGHHDTDGDGVNWNTWRGGMYSLKTTTMMIRDA